MRWFRSLRVRLTAVFLLVAGGAVVAAAIAMGVLVERTVWRVLDAELYEEAESVCALAATGPAESVQRAADATVREPGPGSQKFLLVRDLAGQMLAQAGSVPEQFLGPHAERREGARMVALGPDRSPYRVVEHAGEHCTATLGTVASGYQETVRRAQRVIATTALALLFLLGGLAWLVTSRATAELGRLADEVATIEAGSLGRRLSDRRTLEVDRLAVVLNRLFGRLEASVTHLRRFTADAAHELRTPVAGLRARLEVTLGGATDAVSLRNGLLDALEQTERLGRLAEDLLELSRVEGGNTGTVEAVRLDLLAQEAAEFFEPVAVEGGRRFESHAAVAVTVRGVSGLLTRVLLNLLGNAFRHTPSTAAVRIDVRVDRLDAIVEVADQGPGIPAADLPRVFDRFYRGGTSGTGAGLGLALCQEIVTRHGGTIAIDAGGAGGTVVTVRLPLISVEPQPADLA